jgi:hypothetical protein
MQGEPGGLARRLVDQLHPLARCGGQVDRPVEHRERQRGRRDAAGELRRQRLAHAVDGAERLVAEGVLAVRVRMGQLLGRRESSGRCNVHDVVLSVSMRQV